MLTSFWEVTDNIAPDLLLEFYRQLRKGKTPERALQKAQLEFLESPSKYGHSPVIWANYAIVGKRTTLSMRKALQTPMALSVLCLTLASGIFIRSKRKKM